MPLPWALRGLRDGVLTTAWPHHADAYFDGFAAAVDVIDPAGPAARALADQGVLDALCPSGALTAEPGGISLDRGRCVAAVPRVFAARVGSDTAALSRPQLVVGATDDSDDRQVDQLRRELATRVRRLRRSLHIRHVDAGSDG